MFGSCLHISSDAAGKLHQKWGNLIKGRKISLMSIFFLGGGEKSLSQNNVYFSLLSHTVAMD